MNPHLLPFVSVEWRTWTYIVLHLTSIGLYAECLYHPSSREDERDILPGPQNLEPIVK